MKIFNQAMTEETTPDMERGYLRPGRRLVASHEAVPERVIKTAEQVKEELVAAGREVNLRSDGKLYVVTKRFENGNEEEEVEPVVVPAQEAREEFEDVLVYVPYSEEELKRREIAALKRKLFESDYRAIKYAEGALSEEEYAPAKAERQAWRDRIGEIERSLAAEEA